MPQACEKLQSATGAFSVPEEEVWKTFPLHNGYQISNLGKVIGPRGPIKPSLTNSGRLGFHYWIQGNPKQILLHRAVLLSFEGNPPEGKPHGLHRNHIPTDCRLSNLYWGDDQDNSNDKIAAGRGKWAHGEEQWAAQLTEEQVITIRQAYKAGQASLTDLAKQYNSSPQNIYAIVNYKTWRHVA